MIKELDKQLDRIKIAYIKGILKLEDFDKEIKHIEFQKTEIIKKQQEQKQYDNLNLSVDDLIILQDKQDIDIFSNPTELLNSIYNWYDLPKENKQKLIGKYIDNLIIEKKDKTIKVITGNFRESYIKEIMHNHDKYDILYSWNIFEYDYGFKIPMNHELKTKEQETILIN